MARDGMAWHSMSVAAGNAVDSAGYCHRGLDHCGLDHHGLDHYGLDHHGFGYRCLTRHGLIRHDRIPLGRIPGCCFCSCCCLGRRISNLFLFLNVEITHARTDDIRPLVFLEPGQNAVVGIFSRQDKGGAHAQPTRCCKI